MGQKKGPYFLLDIEGIEGKMKIGFIGAGNMGGALINGYVKANPGAEKNIFVYDINTSGLKKLADDAGIQPCGDIKEVVEKADILVLAVKPNMFLLPLKEIVSVDGWREKVIVSIAAGISLRYISDQCGMLSGLAKEGEQLTCKVVRVMPNTPALIGEGMTALSKNTSVSDEEFKEVMNIFKVVGKAEEVNEELMDSVVGVSGSAPAYVYMFIEAMADGAVSLGMSRKQAYTFAAQAVKGSAEMVQSTGLHPGELKDNVCSPAGTTIEAVSVLEREGFRNATIAAVKAAGKKSKEMTK